MAFIFMSYWYLPRCASSQPRDAVRPQPGTLPRRRPAEVWRLPCGGAGPGLVPCVSVGIGVLELPIKAEDAVTEPPVAPWWCVARRTHLGELFRAFDDIFLAVSTVRQESE